MKGKITLGRYDNYDEPLPIHITIKDDLSGIEFIKISMTLENLANLITNRGYIDCDFEFNAIEKVGLTREHKTEIVELPEEIMFISKPENEKVLDDALKPFEVDGWIGRKSDLTNYHNRVKNKNAFSVSFFRWVSK